MKEAIIIGPFGGPKSPGEGYSDRRGISNIEWEIKENGGNITFARILSALQERFPTDSPLQVFEGGCGYAHTLTDMKGLAAPYRSMTTTGISKEKKHGIAAEWIDSLIIGSVQRAHQLELLQSGSFHFALDIRGAMHYDRTSLILPIYGDILQERGLLLAWIMELNPDNGWNMLGGRAHAKEIERRALRVVSQNNFRILESAKEYTLLEKAADPQVN